MHSMRRTAAGVLTVLGMLAGGTLQAGEPGKLLGDVLALTGPQAPVELQLKAGERLAFMGDSITQQAGYVRLVEYVLKTAYPDIKTAPLINAGISGHKAENMVTRFEKDMKLAEKPNWAFISVGINDVWHRVGAPHDPAVLATFQKNVTEMVTLAQAAGAKVVLLTPTVIQEDPAQEGNKRLVMYVDAMKQIAAEKKCAVADLHDLFLKAMAARKTPVKFTSDGVHMAAYGDAIMAIGVLRALGMPDDKIAAVDVTPILKVRGMGSLTAAAELLEVPVTRFAKPELLSLLGF